MSVDFWIGLAAGVLAGWALGWAVTSWWRDRHEEPPAGEMTCWACGEPSEGRLCDDCIIEPLPPERTWEQMTSHQLPIVGMSAPERKHWQRLERARKRRARLVETTHRAHYAAMGLDYPSGLMARVREAAP